MAVKQMTEDDMVEREVTVGEILEHCDVLDLRPNDVLVLMHDGVMTEEMIRRLRDTAREAFGHDRVVVFDEGLKMGVIRQEET